MIKIRKVNEVYIQIKLNDLGIAQELSDYFTYMVPGYQYMPAYKNKIWDGKIRLYNITNSSIYAGLAKYVELFCKERGYPYEYEYDNSINEVPREEIEEFIKSHKFKLKPRDYQIKAFVDAIRFSRSLFLSPTASGKSFIMYMIMRYYLLPTLIVVPTTTLIHQMFSDFESYGFNSKKYIHKIYAGQEKETDKPIVVTTWQSIYKLKKSWFDRYQVVFGDEAHLFKAKSLSSIMSKMTDCKYRFGFTGTLDGTQTHKLVLEGLFGPVNNVTTTKELMEQKHLSDFKISIIRLSYSDEVKQVVSMMKYQDEMDYIVTHDARNNFIKKLALSLEGNTLLLFQYVDKHGQLLYNRIQDENSERKVYFIHGGVKGEDRDEIRYMVENENDSIIVASYGTFSTGINIRNLHNIIFASPSKSRIRNLQSIGRALRKGNNKTEATLYDIADDFSTNTQMNFTMRHLLERIKTYKSEKFDFKSYSVEI